MKRYEKYKPSLTKWTSSIPQHWKQVRGKSVFYNQKQINTDNTCENVLSLTLKGVIQNNKEKPIGLSPKDYCTYQIFEPNDLVFKLIDLENISTSRVGLVPERGIMSSAYIRLCQRGNENIRYMYYQYFDLYLRNIFNGLGAGVRSTLTASDLLDLPIMIPSCVEQDQIVRYLDWQVSKINRLIAAKKQEIALFEESKINHIANVVLHGIRHHEHCIETTEFGSIPAHWQIIQNKRLFCERVEHSETGTETLLSVSKHYGVKPSAELTEDEQFATIKPALSLIGYKVVRKNDLVMNIMRARNGSYGISDYDGIVSPAYCIYYTTKECNVKYLHYFLRTPHVKSLFEAYSSGIAEHRRRLYPEDFLRLKSVLPPIEEQDEIVEHIEQAIVKYDAGIANFRQQIDCLQDMKTRLISDVVTGQVDVRGIEVPQYEIVEDTDTSEDLEEDTEGEEYEE